MRTTIGCIVLFFALFGGAASLSAEVIGGSVLRSPPQFQSNSYYGMNKDRRFAFPFQVVAGGPWMPENLEVPLSYYPGEPGSVAVFNIYTDDSGQPGSSLATFPVLGITAEEAVYSVAPSYVAGPLQGGATYWLVGSTPAGWVDWNLEWDVFNDLRAYSVDGGAWDVQSAGNISAFAILGSPVPEPASAVLLGIGAVSLLAYAGRRQRRPNHG
jgi:hypothetical protein